MPLSIVPMGIVSTPVADITCDVAARRLWDYIDGRLPDLPRAELEAHLAVCAACPTHVAFARAMRRALADAGTGGVPEGLHAALRTRLRAALGEARGQPGTGRLPGGERPRNAEDYDA